MGPWSQRGLTDRGRLLHTPPPSELKLFLRGGSAKQESIERDTRITVVFKQIYSLPMCKSVIKPKWCASNLPI